MISQVTSSPSFAGKVQIGKNPRAKKEMAAKISRFPAEQQDSIIAGLNGLKANLENNTADNCKLMIGFHTNSQKNPDDYMCAYVYGTGDREHTRYAHAAHRTDGSTTIMDATADIIKGLFDSVEKDTLDQLGADESTRSVQHVLNRLA